MAAKKSTGEPAKDQTGLPDAGYNALRASLRSMLVELALESHDNTTLGKCIVGELVDFIEPILELSNPETTGNANLARRLKLIHGIATQGRRHAENMDAHLESIAQRTYDRYQDEQHKHDSEIRSGIPCQVLLPTDQSTLKGDA
ncbi:MAG: hypothetical protein JWR22_1297 [Herminiimonas sp.]|nr:hypothetical protein [Herminiimonas sp.]